MQYNRFNQLKLLILRYQTGGFSLSANVALKFMVDNVVVLFNAQNEHQDIHFCVCLDQIISSDQKMFEEFITLIRSTTPEAEKDDEVVIAVLNLHNLYLQDKEFYKKMFPNILKNESNDFVNKYVSHISNAVSEYLQLIIDIIQLEHKKRDLLGQLIDNLDVKIKNLKEQLENIEEDLEKAKAIIKLDILEDQVDAFYIKIDDVKLEEKQSSMEQLQIATIKNKVRFEFIQEEIKFIGGQLDAFLEEITPKPKSRPSSPKLFQPAASTANSATRDGEEKESLSPQG